MTSAENRPPGTSERLLHLINILYHICLRWRRGGGVSGLGWNKHIWPRSAGPYRESQNNICWRRDFQSNMQRRGKTIWRPLVERKHYSDAAGSIYWLVVGSAARREGQTSYQQVSKKPSWFRLSLEALKQKLEKILILMEWMNHQVVPRASSLPTVQSHPPESSPVTVKLTIVSAPQTMRWADLMTVDSGHQIRAQSKGMASIRFYMQQRPISCCVSAIKHCAFSICKSL